MDQKTSICCQTEHGGAVGLRCTTQTWTTVWRVVDVFLSYPKIGLAAVVKDTGEQVVDRLLE